MRRGFALPVVLVLACALPLGYFAWKTFMSYVPPDYRPLLRWEAPWISHPRSQANQAYYRKKLHLGRVPTHAWIAVIAPDQFALFVNGRRVVGADGAANEESDVAVADTTRTKWTTFLTVRGGTYTQTVFDITPHLTVGTNVLAIYNKVATFPQQARIAVQGAYVDSSGQSFSIRSDAGWKVTWRDESLTSQGGSVTPTPWFAPEYDDGRWPYVVAGGIPAERMTTGLAFPPPLATEPLRSDWLWAETAASPEAYLRLTLDLPARPRDAWLRVAAKRHYRVLVNEYPLLLREQGLGTEASDENVVRFYGIAPFLRSGRNVIAVQASNDRADRGLALDGLLMARDGTLSWLPSAAWKAAPRPVRGWATLTFDDSGWRPAVSLKPVTPAEQASLASMLGTIDAPVWFHVKMVLSAALMFTVSALGCVLLWLLSTRLISRLTGESLLSAAKPVAFTFVAPGVLLAALYLLGFDPRLSAAFPFQPAFVVGTVGLLLALHVALIVGAALSRIVHDRHVRVPGSHWWHTLRSSVAIDPGLLLAIALGVVGFRLRLHELTREALIGDEVNALQWSLGVLERGYPSIVLDDKIKPAFTSELVYYVKALAIWLVGPDAYGLRLTDVIFGSLTIVLLYCVGKCLHGTRVGLLAAACYTVLPSAIGMTHYARYPSQLQFFALLTFVVLFRAMQGGHFRPRLYWAAIASFIATYFSWEGSAFYGLALAMGVFVLTRPNFDWMRRGQMWAGVGIVTGIVIIQLSLRFADQIDWPSYGTGLQDVAPALAALYPFYDPFYYVWTFFLLENHHILTLLFALGAPLWFRRSADGRILGFMAMTLLANLALMGNLLELAHWRYAYHLLPLLVLSASMVVVVVLDHTRAFCRAPRILGVCVNGIRHTTAAVVVGGFILFSTSFVVKLYDLPWSYASQYTRLGTRYTPTTAGAAEYVRPRLLPGDVLVSVTPHVWRYYLGRADYYFEPQLDQALFLGADPGFPIHRNAGVPSLLSPSALNQMREPAPRVWFVSIGRNPANPEMDAQLVYEDWRSAVFLFGPLNEPLDSRR